MSKIKANYASYKKKLSNIRKYYEKSSVASTLAVVLSLFLVSFFIIVALRPTLVKIAELRKTIEESEKTLAQLETKVQALNRASQVWNEATPYLGYLQTSIPIEPEYRSLYKEIEALALREGVVYKSGSLGSVILSSRLAFPYEPDINMDGLLISYSMNVEGEYIELVDFMRTFITLDRIMSVDSISFNETTDTENSDFISLNISGKAHYFAKVDVVNQVMGVEK